MELNDVLPTFRPLIYYLPKPILKHPVDRHSPVLEIPVESSLTWQILGTSIRISSKRFFVEAIALRGTRPFIRQKR